eukprot:1297593-Rhodomonas_salina.1
MIKNDLKFVRPDDSGRHVCAMALRQFGRSFPMTCALSSSAWLVWQLSYRAVKLAHILRGAGEDSGRDLVATGGCCAICLDDVEEGGESGVSLPCRHVYHQSCLDHLVSSGHSSCPQCRDDVAGVGSLEAVLGSVLQVVKDVQKDLTADKEDEDDLPPSLELDREDGREDGVTSAIAWEVEPVEPDVGQVGESTPRTSSLVDVDYDD